MIILEDDAILAPEFGYALMSMSDSLIENNDVLVLGYGIDYARIDIIRQLLEFSGRKPETFSWERQDYFILDCRAWYCHGTHAMIINRKSRNKILDLAKQFHQEGIFLPIDMFYKRCFVEGRLKGVILFPSMVAVDIGLPSQMQDRSSTKNAVFYLTISNLFVKGISVDDMLKMTQYFPLPSLVNPRVEVMTRVYQSVFSKALRLL